mgnify:CR=1 FL=1|jgi:hypothetical protein
MFKPLTFIRHSPDEMKFLLFLAQRVRRARRVYRRMRALPNVPPLILGEAEGRMNEAWNSFQIAKTLVNPSRVDTVPNTTEFPDTPTPLKEFLDKWTMRLGDPGDVTDAVQYKKNAEVYERNVLTGAAPPTDSFYSSELVAFALNFNNT